MPAEVLARVVRSGFVESVHHGHAVALDADGAVVLSAGDPGAAILPRSALKQPFAVGMVRLGLDLPPQLLALAQSSHSGEAFHLDGVRRLLATAGLDVTDLRNANGTPLGRDEALVWTALGRPANRLAHGCSGKHAAMIVTAGLNGWHLKEYQDPAHPLQRALREVVAELAQEEVTATAMDGCGAPSHAISLTGMARAFARIATAAPGSSEHAVAEAARRHPEWVGGTGRYVTELARAVPGLLVKDGAEAVAVAALPDGRALAVKVADGCERPMRPVLRAVLGALGVATPALESFGRVAVLGHGVPVGEVRATAAVGG